MDLVDIIRRGLSGWSVQLIIRLHQGGLNLTAHKSFRNMMRRQSLNVIFYSFN